MTNVKLLLSMYQYATDKQKQAIEQTLIDMTNGVKWSPRTESDIERCIADHPYYCTLDFQELQEQMETLK